MDHPAHTAWTELAPPWRRCLELAWEAYGAGTIPVGAVVSGPDDHIVAEGRNRVYAAPASGT
jgi:tRNA(Arg) A34 adenosine deaminase TadA